MRYQVYIENGGAMPDLTRSEACTLRRYLIECGYKAHVRPETNGNISELNEAKTNTKTTRTGH